MIHPISWLVEDHIVRSLHAFPAVYIAGPRQSGKTTLVQHIAKERHQAQYITFDDLQLRSAALRGPVVLDEIQMVPGIFRPLKMVAEDNFC